MKKLIPIGIALMPALAFATGIPAIITTLTGIINTLVPFLIAVAVVIFLVGVVKYVTAGADETKRAEGRNVMIYGIIGLFVMISIWGLVTILNDTFGLNVNVNIPTQALP